MQIITDGFRSPLFLHPRAFSAHSNICDKYKEYNENPLKLT